MRLRLSPICRLAALFLFTGLLAGVSCAQQDAQQPSGDPVADAARKARADQKAAAKPKKVFTNDDMPSTPPPTAAPAGTAAAGGQGEVSTQGGQGKDGKDDAENDAKGETYWRKKFQKQHEKISAAEQELDVLQRELNKDQVQYYPDPQKALMQQHDRSDINDKTAKIDAKKKQVDDLKQELSDMEDALRKAGGDPGWAR